MRARGCNSWESPYNPFCDFMDLKICLVYAPDETHDAQLWPVLDFPDTEGLFKPHSHLCPCTGHKGLNWGNQIGRTQLSGDQVTDALVLIPAICLNHKLPEHSCPPQPPKSQLVTEMKRGRPSILSTG